MKRVNSALEQIDRYRWRLPREYRQDMRVPGIIYASREMLPHITEENVLGQVANVACLPGIIRASMAMPDVHWGYGFPIGGVAATDLEGGVVSPGGVGFDINCGVRLLRTGLDSTALDGKLEKLVRALWDCIPSGLGTTGIIRLGKRDMEGVLTGGACWAVEQGYGRSDDLLYTEENGQVAGADPDAVGLHARERGSLQLGPLGAGNHFVEIGVVDEIYEPEAARVMGIEKTGQVLVWIHTGSRGLGHQVADDYIKVMLEAMPRYGISVPDRQLACAPVSSKEGNSYLGAMRSAANYAWANRQIITHHARQAFASVINAHENSIGLDLVYDVSHNIAKIESHSLEGKARSLCVHRKGATRAFPPGHAQLPDLYSAIGQPVLVPGDMGRYSYILTGTQTAMEETFGSTCHGAGRMKSRKEAKRIIDGREFVKELAGRGIVVQAGSLSGIAEEASLAYKDITSVIDVVAGAGLSKPIARTRPVGVIKG
jgi:tRNA-splicing ligase RtcB